MSEEATDKPRPGPGHRGDYRAFRTIGTRWMDNDVYGHMNNVVHYSLFDTAVNGWLIEAGVLDIRSGTQVGLVVETGCRYFAEMAFPDVVTAGLRVARLGKSSVRYDVGLFRNDEERAAAEGFFVHVYVDRETRRPMPLAPALRAALAALTTG
nr:acyl-CoA thioesterase [Amorphus coralli]